MNLVQIVILSPELEFIYFILSQPLGHDLLN